MSHTIKAKISNDWNYHFMTIFLIQYKKIVETGERSIETTSTYIQQQFLCLEIYDNIMNF